MKDLARDIHGFRVLVCAPDGPVLASEQDAATFMGDAWAQDATIVAIPVERLDDSFFRLSTRLAGHVLQKFTNYRLRMMIVGDISAWIAESNALRDFVYEANQGQTVWFVDDLDALEKRLSATAQS